MQTGVEFEEAMDGLLAAGHPSSCGVHCTDRDGRPPLHRGGTSRRLDALRSVSRSSSFGSTEGRRVGKEAK